MVGHFEGVEMSKMIPDLEGYFRQFVPSRDSLLLELEEEARQEGIPIVGPVVAELLYMLVRASHAGQILELGTATGGVWGRSTVFQFLVYCGLSLWAFLLKNKPFLYFSITLFISQSG